MEIMKLLPKYVFLWLTHFRMVPIKQGLINGYPNKFLVWIKKKKCLRKHYKIYLQKEQPKLVGQT